MLSRRPNLAAFQTLDLRTHSRRLSPSRDSFPSPTELTEPVLSVQVSTLNGFLGRRKHDPSSAAGEGRCSGSSENRASRFRERVGRGRQRWRTVQRQLVWIRNVCWVRLMRGFTLVSCSEVRPALETTLTELAGQASRSIWEGASTEVSMIPGISFPIRLQDLDWTCSRR